MLAGLLGKKIGMTQIFDEVGRAVPVTIIEIGPCHVVQVKTEAKDGYAAAQLAIDAVKPKNSNQATMGHFQNTPLKGAKFIREVAIVGEGALKAGDTVTVDFFEGVDRVHITGKSVGKGFQGVMKRHNARGGPGSHGSMFNREPGSIGSSAFPSRVFKGMKLPGHMGAKRITTKNIKVQMILAENNLLLVRGSVPGSAGSYVTITKA